MSEQPMRRLNAGSIAMLAALAGVVGLLVVVLLAAEWHAHARPLPATPSTPTPQVVIGGTPPAHGRRAGARDIARRFLQHYIDFLYGRGHAEKLPAAERELRRRLRRARVRVPPGRAERTPRIAGLRASAQAAGVVRVTASVDDGDLVVYPIAVVLERHGARWVVSHVVGD